jgi:hypothetical protein
MLLEPLLQFFWWTGDGSRSSENMSTWFDWKRRGAFLFQLWNLSDSWFSMTLKSHQDHTGQTIMTTPVSRPPLFLGAAAALQFSISLSHQSKFPDSWFFGFHPSWFNAGFASPSILLQVLSFSLATSKPPNDNVSGECLH